MTPRATLSLLVSVVLAKTGAVPADVPAADDDAAFVATTVWITAISSPTNDVPCDVLDATERRLKLAALPSLPAPRRPACHGSCQSRSHRATLLEGHGVHG